MLLQLLLINQVLRLWFEGRPLEKVMAAKFKSVTSQQGSGTERRNGVGTKADCWEEKN